MIAKRRDSRYEPGQRSGAWQKMRVNRGQAFVIAGYTPASGNFDAIVFGYRPKAIWVSCAAIWHAPIRNGKTICRSMRPWQSSVDRNTT